MKHYTSFEDERPLPSRPTSLWQVFAVLILVMLLSACAADEPEPTVVAEIAATATATPTLTPSATPTLEPTQTSTPTITPTPGPWTPSEIFEQISPSIAFVETAVGSGSGILIQGNYLLTNAHVVWPYQEVRVVLADGSEHLRMPVVNMDLMTDLAIVGPIETDAKPLALVNGEDLITASTVYLVGYPGEVDEFPQPTITQGILSRMREWEAQEISYFQTDATIVGGQSGGALVSDRGEIIGLSGFAFYDFGLVASASDIAPRVESLIAGEDVADLGKREINADRTGQLALSGRLINRWASTTYFFSERAGKEVEIEVDGAADLNVFVQNAAGIPELYVDDSYDGSERATFETEAYAPYFVTVSQQTGWSEFFQLSSNVPLIKLNDPDDGQDLKSGDELLGAIDYPGDFDVYQRFMNRGEIVHLRVDSTMIDPQIIIDFPGALEHQIVADSDSGGGIFGFNAELTYRAPADALYYIIVRSEFDSSIGGYTLLVDEEGVAAPTPMAPPPTPTPIAREVGDMALYESELNRFSMEYPASLVERVSDIPFLQSICNFVTACFYDGQLMLTILEEDLGTVLLDSISLNDFASAVKQNSLQNPSFRLVSQRTIETAVGPAIVYRFNISNGTLMTTQFIYLHDDVGFVATYFDINFEELAEEGELLHPDLIELMERDLAPLIEHSFSSFNVEE